jgi:hypothetical protein
MKKYLAEAHFSLDGTSQMTESRPQRDPGAELPAYSISRRKFYSFESGRLGEPPGTSVWIPDDGDQDSETMSIKITK